MKGRWEGELGQFTKVKRQLSQTAKKKKRRITSICNSAARTFLYHVAMMMDRYIHKSVIASMSR
jgi:DNA topoisomerase IB